MNYCIYIYTHLLSFATQQHRQAWTPPSSHCQAAQLKAREPPVNGNFSMMGS